MKPNDFNEEGSENGKASSKVLSWQSLLKSHLSSFIVLLRYPHLIHFFFLLLFLLLLFFFNGAGQYEAPGRTEKEYGLFQEYFQGPFTKKFHKFFDLLIDVKL